MNRDWSCLWQRWRIGLGVTTALHGAALAALIVQFRDAPPPAAPPSLSVQLIAAPPAPAPQPRPASTGSAAPTVVKQAAAPTPRPIPLAQPRPNAAGTFTIPPPARTAPRPAAAEPSPAAAAPASPPPASAAIKSTVDRAASASTADPASARSWEAAVVAQLEAAKRYPASARFAHQQATIYARFTVDRRGKVVRIDLVRASPVPDLNMEVRSLFRRVTLPPPPSALSDADLTMTVPIEFSLDTP